MNQVVLWLFSKFLLHFNSIAFSLISPFWCKFSSGNWKHKVSDDKFQCGGTWRRRKIDERSSNENRFELIQLKWICYGEELVILTLDMHRLISSEFHHNVEINLVSISCACINELWIYFRLASSKAARVHRPIWFIACLLHHMKSQEDEEWVKKSVLITNTKTLYSIRIVLIRANKSLMWLLFRFTSIRTLV